MAIAIFVFCIVGCSYMSFRSGRAEGISEAVQYLIEAGVIEIEETEE